MADELNFDDYLCFCRVRRRTKVVVIVKEGGRGEWNKPQELSPAALHLQMLCRFANHAIRHIIQQPNQITVSLTNKNLYIYKNTCLYRLTN